MGEDEVPVIADERDLMSQALHLMRDAFTEACALVPDYDAQGRFQGRFFDGYAGAKLAWRLALLKRDVLGKGQPEIDGGHA